MVEWVGVLVVWELNVERGGIDDPGPWEEGLELGGLGLGLG